MRNVGKKAQCSACSTRWTLTRSCLLIDNKVVMTRCPSCGVLLRLVDPAQVPTPRSIFEPEWKVLALGPGAKLG